MRRRFFIVVAGLSMVSATFGFGPATRATANQSCSQAPDSSYTNNGTSWDCNWTQIDNANWPSNSQSPNCTQYCAWYIGGYGHGNCQWYQWTDNVNYSDFPNTSGVDFDGAADKEIKQWGAEPYCSPGWGKCQGCSGDMLTVRDANEPDPSWCGTGNALTAWNVNGQQYDNHVVSSYLEYNNHVGGTWYPGPPTNSGFFCDVYAIAAHEAGHAMTEGHASLNSADIMYWGGGGTDDKIDGDATAMLNSVYGPYHQNGGSGSGGGCSGCNSMACPQVPAVTAANVPPGATVIDPAGDVNNALWAVCGTSNLYIDGYYAKAWDASQGVALPNAAWYITQAENKLCWPYVVQKQLVPWANCLTGGIY